MEKSLNWREFIITRLIQTSGYSAIVFVALIFFFLLREGIPTLGEVKLSNLLSARWYPHRKLFWDSAAHHRLARRHHRRDVDRVSIGHRHSRLHFRNRPALDARDSQTSC
jgi:hypothetical protein